jgi:hypothetical protein
MSSTTRRPQQLCTDSGSEFKNKKFEQYMNKEKIKHYFTRNELHSSGVERVIKSLKTNLMRYMQFSNTHNWVSVLEQFTYSYNASYHRTIKMSPMSVTKNNAPELIQRLYIEACEECGSSKSNQKHYSENKIKSEKKKIKRKNFKYKVGQQCRLSKIKLALTRQYHEYWTKEVFVIYKRARKGNYDIYFLEDLNGSKISGTFYPEELQPISIKEQHLWKIEKVLKTRKYRGQKQSLVRWEGFTKHFDSWINSKDIENI